MLGSKVKVLRGQLDLTRKALAKDLNIPYQTLSKYEANEREPNIDTLKKIADYFSISIDELLERNYNFYPSDTMVTDENRVSIPVFTKLFRGIDHFDKDNVAWYENVLVQPENLGKQYFYYIAEDMSLQGLRIHQQDKLLLEAGDSLSEDSIVLLQIGSAEPMIRMAYIEQDLLILSANLPSIKPQIIPMDQNKKQIKFIGKIIKVEFTP